MDVSLGRKPDVLSFTGNVADNWHKFERDYDVFIGCLPEDTSEKRRAMLLLNLAGPEAVQKEQSFVYLPRIPAVPAAGDVPAQPEVPAEDRGNVAVLKRKFRELCSPQTNVIMERYAFNSRFQEPEESFNSFYAELRVRASSCNFGTLEEDLIRDKIVIGIKDNNLRKQLLKENQLTLQRAVSLCQIAEETDQAMDKLTSRADAVNRRKQPQSRGTERRDKEKPKKKEDKSKKCDRCGYVHKSTGPKACPALGATCRNCGKKNHFASVCRSPQVNTVLEEEDLTASFLGSISEKSRSCQDQTPVWSKSLLISGKRILFKIDSGADVSIISKDTYTSLIKPPKLQCYSNNRLTSPGGPVKTIGWFPAQATLKNIEYHFKIVVIEDQVENLLSRGAASTMNLIKRVDRVSTKEEFGRLDTKPVEIQLTQEHVPYSIPVSRRVPIPLESKVKAELERLKEGEIIEEITKPTDWCAPMVPVLKPSGQVRLCVDLKKLNAAVKRERYILPTLEDVISKLSGARVFSCLDAASGFYQIPLHENSQELTTFVTPFGRFCFKRLPFGISSAPEIFMRKMTELLEGLEGVFCYMDDVLVFGKDSKEHDSRLEEVLNKMKKAGLKLNQQKCKFRQDQIAFLGHVFDAKGVRPDPQKITAINDMPAPTSIDQLRQFLGIVHYLGSYLPNLHSATEPLNELLRKDRVWTWEEPQEDAFKKIKKLVTSAPVLSFYDVTKPTHVTADASSFGIGGAILQLHDNCWKPIAFCSRSLTSAERNYAQIEKECLAGVWACEKFTRFLYGLEEITLITDHKPLVPLINCKNLSEVPIRCQRLLMRLMRFRVKAEHHPGKTLVVSDALSRNPVDTSPPDTQGEEDVKVYADSVIEFAPASEARLEEIRRATAEDPVLSRVVKLTREGWPRRQHDVPDEVVQYYKLRSDLSYVSGILTLGCRIVVPKVLQTSIVDRLHDGHQGVEKTLDLAKNCVWWPGMIEHIKLKTRNCDLCNTLAAAQRKEPLMPSNLPEGPWRKLGMDLCLHNNHNYLVVTDYYSRFLEIIRLSKDTTSHGVIENLKSIFARHGLPEEIISDNGPQFASQQFKQFTQDCRIKHSTSSPHFPSSNGAAERAVQTAKKILSQKDPWLGLLAHRSTPQKSTGFSPSQLLMGRRLRTTVPCLTSSLQPKWPSHKLVKRRDSAAKQQYSRQYNRRHGVRPLPHLTSGQPVRVRTEEEQRWRRRGTIVSDAATPRSYVVQMDNGNTLRRNRRHIMPDVEENNHPETLAPTEIPDPRRSTRISIKPSRLIEEC